MKSFLAALTFFVIAAFTFFLIVPERYFETEEEEEGFADEAFEWWYAQRALPGNIISPDGITNAYNFTRREMSLQKKFTAEEPWEMIGPDNIGGRVLSLAIDPDSSNIIWAGSASGGLWRSRTGGAGVSAWEYVNTGMYVISVSSIAINPKNANEMYAGMGEISGYNLGQVGTPGARTTYGGGIVKSADRGKTWAVTGLNWEFSLNRSVQKVAINPKNPKTIFAATSEGTYRSYDAGATFVRALDTLMAMDVVINPSDTSIIYVACGQRNTAPNSGLYKSTNGGATFTKLAGGLPANNFGRTSLAISQSNPSIVYASISDAVTHNLAGLYKTTNNGASWELMSQTNYLSGQGWYNNICEVHPANPNIVYGAGLDAYKSTTGGSNLTRKSYWYKSLGGVVPAGGQEGSDNSYAHADHHAIIFDPKNSNRMFFGTDGGVFESTDGGETFIGRNGGFKTTQFYNGFANSFTDSLIALGGLQDNGTIKWQGQMSWNKVYGGDGGWCAIHPTNKNIMFEEYVYLSISKSTDGGNNWKNVFNSSSDSSNFIAPFVIAPSNGNILYAGSKKMHKSTDAGETWFTTNNNQVLNGANLSCMDISYTNSDTAIVATGQRAIPIFEIFWTTNGGINWTKSTSTIPNRYPTDIAFDPSNSKIAYATFSGYRTSHVYKSTDAGKTWNDISNTAATKFPDIPAQSVCVDPGNSDAIYVGTDLGVYRTLDGGKNWEFWSDGMPFTMVIDVVISPKDRRIRAATFGNGVYQRKLTPKNPVYVLAENGNIPKSFVLEQNYPNPFNPTTTITYTLSPNPSPLGRGEGARVTLKVYDALGREVATLVNENKPAGKYSVSFDASQLSSGVYYYTLKIHQKDGSRPNAAGGRGQAGNYSITKKMLVTK